MQGQLRTGRLPVTCNINQEMYRQSVQCCFHDIQVNFATCLMLIVRTCIANMLCWTSQSIAAAHVHFSAVHQLALKSVNRDLALVSVSHAFDEYLICSVLAADVAQPGQMQLAR